jgi:hypothetical protein
MIRQTETEASPSSHLRASGCTFAARAGTCNKQIVSKLFPLLGDLPLKHDFSVVVRSAATELAHQ